METAKRTTFKLATALLAMVLSVACLIPSASFAADITAQNEEEFVYISISNDGEFVTSPTTGEYMHYVAVPFEEVEAIQLADYGMEQFAWHRGNVEDPSNPDDQGDPGLYPEDTTLMKLFIYVMENYYEAGSWQDVNVTGSSGSSYLQNGFWGHDENLTYYKNGQYPLENAGWGSTSDYIVLEPGDFYDVQMFTDWNFWFDPNAGYHYFTNQAGKITHSYSVQAGQSLEIGLGRAWGNVDVGQNTSLVPESNYDVYYGHEYDSALGYVQTNANGKAQITFNTPGVYCLWVNGAQGVNSQYAVSSPAYAVVTVTQDAILNKIPTLAAGVENVDTTVSIGSSYELVGLASGDVFTDADGQALTYYLETSGDGITWSTKTLMTATGGKYSLAQALLAGTTYYRISAYDGADYSADYWQLKLTAVANTAPYPVASTASAEVKVGMFHKVNLASAFVDDQNDALTYTVSVDGASAVAATSSYKYIPETAGTHTLVFTASDHNLSSTTYTVNINAVDFSKISDPWIEIRLPEGELAAGDLIDVELWLYNVEGVKSSNICFDSSVNLTFVDGTGTVITNLASTQGFKDAVTMSAGSTCTAAQLVSSGNNSRWQFKWNSADGITAGAEGVKVASFSMKMSEAGTPEFDFKNISGTEVLLHSIISGTGLSEVVYNSQAVALEIGSLLTTVVTYGESETPGLLGDVNSDGNVDARDSLAIRQYVASGNSGLNANQLVLADINSDGQVDARDALAIQQSIA